MSDDIAEPTTAAPDVFAEAGPTPAAEAAPEPAETSSTAEPAGAANAETDSEDSPFPVGAEAASKKAKKPRAKKAADPELDSTDGEPATSDPVADPAPVLEAADDTDAPDVTDAGADAADDAGVAVAADTPVEPPPPENKKKWYAIKVQSGREDTIKAAILRKVAIEHLEDGFGQIMVPFDEQIEKKAVRVKDKKTGEYTTQEKKIKKKIKKFPGYIFAELEFDDRMLYLIRDTSGVGDFLKLRPRVNDTPVPEPMTDAEVKQMLGEKVGPESGKVVKLDIEKGDRVRIKEGSFKDSEGEVKDIQMPKDPTDPPKIVVEVTFWGRPLPVELEYWQVAKV